MMKHGKKNSKKSNQKILRSNYASALKTYFSSGLDGRKK
jgi:hypothetical protein